MKITLKNFRCYENSCFDFGKQGLALLSGASGSGKTSILKGIYFSLFGTGTKLIMHDKTSCTVSLEINEMIITRTKRPNRLVVKTKDGEYEDAAAQSIINKQYGESFKTTGYISQNARDSFILMSPIEKLAFLESFAFTDINLCQIKKRCKDLIKERNETLLKTTSQLEMASLMIKEMKQPNKIDFPLKCTKKNREKSINNEIIRNKNTTTLIKRCKRNIILLQKELHSLQLLNAKIQSKQDSLDSVIEKLADLSLEEDKLSYEGDEKLQKYENQLSIIISNRKLISLQDKYDEDSIIFQNMQDDEITYKNTQKKNIKENIWKEYSENECNTTITEHKQIIKDLEKLTDLKNNLHRYQINETQLTSFIQELKDSKNIIEIKKKLLDKLEIQQEIFQCPSCSIPLRFNDDELQIHKDELEGKCDENELEDNIEKLNKEISKLKRTISSLESSIPIKQNKLERYKEISQSITYIENQFEDIPNLSEIKTELEYITNYKSSQEELNKQLTKLNSHDTLSPTITSFFKSLNQLDKKIQQIKSTNNIKPTQLGSNEEELRLNITKQKQNKETLTNLNQNIKLLTNEQTNYETQLSACKQTHLDNYKNIKTESELNFSIKKQLSELSNLEDKQTQHQQNVDDIEKYQQYIKDQETYDTWTKKINILQKEELNCRKLYASSTLLREKILEAESIAMLNIISSINTHSQSYLDAFFPDNPISVKLVTFKESKSGATKGTKKPQINLEIEYKSMEADINMLSGGELSRVILAYSLALGEMFNTPLMLLDECTASLDQDLTGIVMDGIRENFTDTLVIIVAHQVVAGQFDLVVKI